MCKKPRPPVWWGTPERTSSVTTYAKAERHGSLGIRVRVKNRRAIDGRLKVGRVGSLKVWRGAVRQSASVKAVHSREKYRCEAGEDAAPAEKSAGSSGE